MAVAVAPAASVPLLPTPLEKNAPCTFTGWMASCNKLIILTKKKILKMWRAGGESNPSVKNIYGLNANMCFDFLDCPIAAAATESPSCPCVKHTLSLADRVCVKQIKSNQKFMITNYVSKREISLKKAVFGPLRGQSLNCTRNITIRTALARVNAACRRCRVRRWPCSISRSRAAVPTLRVSSPPSR